MFSDNQAVSSITPRTDAAERFLHEPGRPPVGFVASGLARVLEVELNRALTQLKDHGVDAPEPLDARTHALLQTTRRPTASIFRASAQAPSAGSPVIQPPTAQPQVKMLPAVLATEALGEARTYEDGAVLFRRGERAEHLFMVLYGEVRISQIADGGADRVAGPGQVLGEHAIFDDGVHTESVQAVGQARCALVPAQVLRGMLAGDTSLLPQVMMSLVLQYRMVSSIAGRMAAGIAPPKYEVLGQKTLTGPELHRALVEAKAQEPGQGMNNAQVLCLKLQTTDLMPTRLLRAGMSLGRPGEEHLGLGLMTVNGMAQVRIGEHAVQLGQGCVIGVAEGLTGRDFGWTYVSLQDINARVFPIDRALQRLERADPLMRAVASHLCATILEQQAAIKG